MSNFIGMVFGVLKEHGIDTSDMSVEEAIEKYNEIESENKDDETTKNNSKENQETDKNTKFRGQIPYRGKQNAIKSLIEDVGVTENEALEIYNAVEDYTGNLYAAIRDKNNTKEWVKKDKILLEKLIEKSPKFNGEIYRGIRLHEEAGYNYIKSLQKGSIIDMNGIGSWSSDKKRAQGFASKGNFNYKILFHAQNKNGVGIKHLSTFDQEDEVLTSEKQTYKVNSVKKSGNYYLVELEEN